MTLPLPTGHAGHPQSAIWESADDLAHSIYRLTWKFMQVDATLAQRMRSAAITIAVNLAETRRLDPGPRQRRTLHAASAMLGELGYYLHLARRVGLIGDHDLKRVATFHEEVSRQLDTLLGV